MVKTKKKIRDIITERVISKGNPSTSPDILGASPGFMYKISIPNGVIGPSRMFSSSQQWCRPTSSGAY